MALGCMATGAATNRDAAPAVTAAACSGDQKLSGDEVVTRLTSRNAERARGLLDFQGVRQYTIKYTGLPYPQSAEMHVKVAYTAPGKKEFTIVSESGSKLLLSHVLHRLLASERESSFDEASRDAVALTTQNYRFSLVGCESSDGRPQYVMQVEPLRKDKFLYRGTVWIDSQDFAVTRIEAEPAQNPSFWIKQTLISHKYEKIGQFYLPELNQTVTDVRLGGKALLTIRYLDYKLPQLSAAGSTP